MFSDIIISPHISTNQITGAALAGGQLAIAPATILRALMRGRQQYFTGNSSYIHDIIGADDTHSRPSNFIFIDILEFLVRNRKVRMEYNQEGYISIDGLVKEMTRLGYDEDDSNSATRSLIEKGMIEPESLVESDSAPDEPVRVHASGYVHSRLLLRQVEYLVGITRAIKLASRDAATDIGSIWAGWNGSHEMSISNKLRILKTLRDYLRPEYQRRTRRHAFYEELGHGGKHLLQAVEKAHDYMEALLNAPHRAQRAYVPRAAAPR